MHPRSPHCTLHGLALGFAAAAVFLAAAPAFGGAISVSSGGAITAMPADISPGGNESTSLQVYNEQVGFVRAVSTTVDRNEATLTGGGFPSNLFSGSTSARNETLGAGTYDTTMVQWDPVGGTGTTPTVTITFATAIVAIQHHQSTIDGGDSIFALGGVTYATGQQIGTSDNFQLLDAFRLQVSNWNVGAPENLDRIRVFTVGTSEVPEPHGLAALALGVGALTARSRRRNG